MNPLTVSVRLTTVTVRASTAAAQTTSRPAYPPSAHTSVIVENRSRSSATSR